MPLYGTQVRRKSCWNAATVVWIVTSEVYDDDHYHLKQGEVFLVATDGVFENHNNFERLETFVSNRFKRIKTGEKFDVSQLWEACHSDLSTSLDDMSLLVVSFR